MTARVDYKKLKRNATIGIAVSAVILVLALSISLAGLFFFLDASVEASKAQGREERFDQWEDSSQGRQNSYKTWEIMGMTEEFASDFKETYHYCFAFDKERYPFIIKIKGNLGEKYQPYIDYLYNEGEEPELLTVKGVAAPIEDDIRKFAIECMNLLNGDELLTEENFEEYMGISLLDVSEKPMGRADFDAPKGFWIAGFIFGITGAFLLVVNIRHRINYGLAEEREKEAMRRAAMWQNPQENGDEEYIHDSGVRLVPVRKSNMFLGIIGAIGGSLIGVALWLMISLIGFVAGIAGFVMLKFALKGYEKLSGKLDKKGAVISLVIAAFMVLFANILDYVIVLCRAFFEWDASFDTVRYVVMNFGELMTEFDAWRGFGVNLVVGYGLSIWSSFQLIGQIIRYKEEATVHYGDHWERPGV